MSRKDSLSRVMSICLLLAICAGAVFIMLATPGAIEAQVQHNQEVAVSRCTVNGDFDNSTDFCKSVEKQAGQ